VTNLKQLERTKKMKKSMFKKLGLMFAVILVLITASMTLFACRRESEISFLPPGQGINNFTATHDGTALSQAENHSLLNDSVIVLTWNAGHGVVSYLYVNGQRTIVVTSPHNFIVQGDVEIQIVGVGGATPSQLAAYEFMSFVEESIPSIGNINSSHERYINAVLFRLNNLSDEVLYYVSSETLNTINLAEVRINNIRRVYRTVELIDILPTINLTILNEYNINNARNAFNELGAELQNEIPQYYRTKLNNILYNFAQVRVIHLISSIPSLENLTHDYIEDIEYVRDLFSSNFLSNQQRQHIINNTPYNSILQAAILELPFLGEFRRVNEIMQGIDALPVVGNLTRENTQTVENLVNAFENELSQDMQALVINIDILRLAETEINRLNQPIAVTITNTGFSRTVFDENGNIIMPTALAQGVYIYSTIFIEPNFGNNYWFNNINVPHQIVIDEDGRFLIAVEITPATSNIIITRRTTQGLNYNVVLAQHQGNGHSNVVVREGVNNLQLGNNNLPFSNVVTIEFDVENGFRGYVVINGIEVASSLTRVEFEHTILINAIIEIISRPIYQININIGENIQSAQVIATNKNGNSFIVQDGDFVTEGTILLFNVQNNNQNRTIFIAAGDESFELTQGVLIEEAKTVSIVSVSNSTILGAERLRERVLRESPTLNAHGEIQVNENGAVFFSIIGNMFHISAGDVNLPLRLFYFESEAKALAHASNITGNNDYYVYENILVTGNSHGVWYIREYFRIGLSSGALHQETGYYVDLVDDALFYLIGINASMMVFPAGGGNENMFLTIMRQTNSTVHFGGVYYFTLSVRFFDSQEWAMSAFNQPQFTSTAIHRTAGGTFPAFSSATGTYESAASHSAQIQNAIITSNSPALVSFVRDIIAGAVFSIPPEITDEQINDNNDLRNSIINSGFEMDALITEDRQTAQGFEVFNNITLVGGVQNQSATAVFFTCPNHATDFMRARVNTFGVTQPETIAFIRVGNYIIFGDALVASRLAVFMRNEGMGLPSNMPQVNIAVNDEHFNNLDIRNSAGAMVHNRSTVNLGDFLTISWTNDPLYRFSPTAEDASVSGEITNLIHTTSGGSFQIRVIDSIDINFTRVEVAVTELQERAEALAVYFANLDFETSIVINSNFARLEAQGVLFGEDVMVHITVTANDNYAVSFASNTSIERVANRLISSDTNYTIARVELAEARGHIIDDLITEFSRHGFTWGPVRVGYEWLYGLRLSEFDDVLILSTAQGLALEGAPIYQHIRVYANETMAEISSLGLGFNHIRVGRIIVSGNNSDAVAGTVIFYNTRNENPVLRPNLSDENRIIMRNVRTALFNQGIHVVSSSYEVEHRCFALITITNHLGTATAMMFTGTPPSIATTGFVQTRGNVVIFGDYALVGAFIGAFADANHPQFAGTYNLNINVSDLNRFEIFRVEIVGEGEVASGNVRAGAHIRVTWQTRLGYTVGNLAINSTTVAGVPVLSHARQRTHSFVLTSDATITFAAATETHTVGVFATPSGVDLFRISLPESGRLFNIDGGINITDIRTGEAMEISWQAQPGYFVELFIGGARVNVNGNIRTVAGTYSIASLSPTQIHLNAVAISLPDGYWRADVFHVSDRLNIIGNGSGIWTNTNSDGFARWLRGNFDFRNEEDGLGYSEAEITRQVSGLVNAYLSTAFVYRNERLSLIQGDRAVQSVPVSIGNSNQEWRNSNTTRPNLHNMDASLYFNSGEFTFGGLGSRRLNLNYDTQTRQIMVRGSAFGWRYKIEFSFVSTAFNGNYEFRAAETGGAEFATISGLRNAYEQGLTRAFVSGNRQVVNAVIAAKEAGNYDNAQEAVESLSQTMASTLAALRANIVGRNITVFEGATQFFNGTFDLVHYHGSVFRIDANIPQRINFVQTEFFVDLTYMEVFVTNNLLDGRVWLGAGMVGVERWTAHATTPFRFINFQGVPTTPQTLATMLDFFDGFDDAVAFLPTQVGPTGIVIYRRPGSHIGIRVDGRIQWVAYTVEQSTVPGGGATVNNILQSSLFAGLGNIERIRMPNANSMYALLNVPGIINIVEVILVRN